MNGFKKELIEGSVYIAIAKYSNIIFQILISAVLARLLTPGDYGVISIATVFIVFFSVLSNVGIGPAIIQKKELTPDDIDHLFTLTIYIGFFFTSIFFCLSWYISSFYNLPILTPVCQWLSLLILSSCIQTVSINLLYKDKEFKFIGFVNLITSVVFGGVAILMAMHGWGVYSLVTTQVLSSTTTSFIFLIKRPRKIKIHLKLDPIRKVVGYSSYNFLASITNYFILNLDKLLVGKFIGPIGLGFYEKSYRLMFMPIQNITFVIEPVLHPLFSEIQNNFKEIISKYISIINRLALISFMISVFCFFSAKELILLFFGSQWNSAIGPFRIMSLSIGIQMLSMTLGAMFNSTNSTKLSFYSSLLSACIMLVGFLVAIYLKGDILSMAYAFTLTSYISSLISFYLFFKKLSFSFFSFINSLLKPVMCSMILGFFLFVFDSINPNMFILVSLTGKVVIFLCFVFISLYYLYDYNIVKFLVKYKFRDE